MNLPFLTNDYMYQVTFSFVCRIAVTGVATAFAARDILGNILSGFSLQFSRPFSVGDYIKVPV
jgi:small-conductance mechanosensitive channel